MGLFPKDIEIGDSTLSAAPRRMLYTRELGTRKLLLSLAVIAGVWYGASQAYDHTLLQTRWPALAASRAGLTLVGTLNSRDSYDRNLLKIITANKSSRVVLTEFGWNKDIFDVRNGPLFEDKVGNAIRAAIDQDDVTGYAMLSPFLRATINKQLGDTNAFGAISSTAPIIIPKHSENGTDEHTTLGALLNKYEGQTGQRKEASDTPDAGSGSGHEQENVLTIPAETLLETCPIVLTDKQCTGASLEKLEGNMLTPTTYVIHLNLSPEGRSRFFQWSHSHVNENVVFVLNGQIIAAPRISQTLNVSDFTINNIQDMKAAQTLVDYMEHR